MSINTKRLRHRVGILKSCIRVAMASGAPTQAARIQRRMLDVMDELRMDELRMESCRESSGYELLHAPTGEMTQQNAPGGTSAC